MTKDDLYRGKSICAQTTGYTETDICNYLWSILRHPIAPASINHFLTGSTSMLGGMDCSREYADRLERIVKEQGLDLG